MALMAFLAGFHSVKLVAIDLTRTEVKPPGSPNSSHFLVASLDTNKDQPSSQCDERHF